MSRATGPLAEDPRWTDDAKRNWEVITADLGKMWDDVFDTARRAKISRYCDYGYHSQCNGFVHNRGSGEHCTCRECLHV